MNQAQLEQNLNTEEQKAEKLRGELRLLESAAESIRLEKPDIDQAEAEVSKLSSEKSRLLVDVRLGLAQQDALADLTSRLHQKTQSLQETRLLLAQHKELAEGISQRIEEKRKALQHQEQKALDARKELLREQVEAQCGRYMQAIENVVDELLKVKALMKECGMSGNIGIFRLDFPAIYGIKSFQPDELTRLIRKAGQ